LKYFNGLVVIPEYFYFVGSVVAADGEQAEVIDSEVSVFFFLKCTVQLQLLSSKYFSYT
jgi:hypothetical protein